MMLIRPLVVMALLTASLFGGSTASGTDGHSGSGASAPVKAADSTVDGVQRYPASFCDPACRSIGALQRGLWVTLVAKTKAVANVLTEFGVALNTTAPVDLSTTDRTNTVVVVTLHLAPTDGAHPIDRTSSSVTVIVDNSMDKMASEHGLVLGAGRVSHGTPVKNPIVESVSGLIATAPGGANRQLTTFDRYFADLSSTPPNVEDFLNETSQVDLAINSDDSIDATANTCDTLGDTAGDSEMDGVDQRGATAEAITVGPIAAPKTHLLTRDNLLEWHRQRLSALAECRALMVTIRDQQQWLLDNRAALTSQQRIDVEQTLATLRARYSYCDNLQRGIERFFNEYGFLVYKQIDGERRIFFNPKVVPQEGLPDRLILIRTDGTIFVDKSADDSHPW